MNGGSDEAQKRVESGNRHSLDLTDSAFDNLQNAEH